MTDTHTPAEAGTEAAHPHYKAERVADPLHGCVDLNALQNELKALEEQAADEPPAPRRR